MEIIKITSLGCPSCIIMNNILEEISNEYNINIIDYDYDFDDVENFNVGTKLPVIIFMKDGKEITRICGEHDKEKIIEIIGE